MKAMTRLVAAIVALTGATYTTSVNASWWDSDRHDRYYDRWHGGPWYGGYPGYGYGYPGYGWGGYPGHGYGPSTIIVNPSRDSRDAPPPAIQPQPRLPE
jgi:hypothetical protein